MPPLRASAFFVLRLGLAYGLLIVPWPRWNRAYSGWFRAFNQAIFTSNAHRIIRFDAAKHAPPPLDTQIELGNRDRVDSKGNVSGTTLALDSRAIGWVPTALFLALTLATSLEWRRRTKALAYGLILIHAFIALSVGCFILNRSADIGMVALGPFWKGVAQGLEETLVTQLGPSFVFPAMIWFAVTFRAKDLKEWAGGSTRTS